MSDYRFRIVNVFAEDAVLSGNPLAVIEDGRGLSDETMQALALQFNLSETTFVLPSAAATAQVRIFTPTFEMPFAGHPTLGTAHVVRDVLDCGDRLTLEMRVGIVPVSGRGDRWTLQAKAPRTREPAAPREALASMLGLTTADLGTTPLWIDTGSEQLVVPLASADAVRRATPDPALLVRLASLDLAGSGTRAMAYVWARAGEGQVLSRFFFVKHGAALEDPGTGSACANLGGWLVATGAPRPQSLVVAQGAAVGRPCRLELDVDADQRIFVSGRVIDLGRGTISL
ncbi:MAG TPA: PhzF family phenazine biosynthesis protein [Casimicrobiaceae bacterium]|nr:PhzF family phenazine biosynthesis protein [Casimicrobiaceae bacterium]